MAMYNKNNLAIHKIASTNNARPILQTVRFEPECTVATDGYKLMIVQNAPELDSESVEGLDGMHTQNGNYTVSIDKDTVAKVMRDIPAKPILPFLKGTFFTATSDNEVAELMTTDGTNHQKHITRPIQGDYPAYHDILPKGTPACSVSVSIKHLKAILDTLNTMDIPESIVKIDLYANEKSEANKPSLKPINITAMTSEGQNIQAVVMPIRMRET